MGVDTQWAARSMARARQALARCSPWVFSLLAAVAIAAAIVASQSPPLQITASARASAAGNVQSYYANDGSFSEFRSQVWPLAEQRATRVALSIPEAHSANVRLDPSPGLKWLELCDVVLVMPSGQERQLAPRRFVPVNDVELRDAAGCARLEVREGAADPQLRVDLADLQQTLGRERARRVRAALAWTACSIVMLMLAGGAMRLRVGTTLVETHLATLTRSVPAIYVGFALVVGGLYAIVTPPGAVPDEPAHIAKTILVENGTWLGTPTPEGLDPGLDAVLGPFGDFLDPSRRFTTAQVLAHAAAPLACAPNAQAFPRSATGYAPSMYLPGALALNAACHTGDSVGMFIYGGRVLNLILSALLVFFGLRAAGPHAWPLFAVATMPMVLFEQASLTADSFIFGVTFCLIGLQVGIATGHARARQASELSMLVLGLALAFSKPGYAWVCAGFLLCWRTYAATGRPFWWRALALVALPWLAHLAWVLFTVEAAAPRAGVDPAVNLHAFVARPGETLRLWSDTFLGEGSGFLWSSVVGRLGWLDVPLHPAAYALALAAILASLGMLPHNPQGLPSPRTRALAAGLALASAMLPVLPMYLFWTPAGALAIEGLQGRYFIPAIAFMVAWLCFRAPLVARMAAPVLLLMVPVAVNLDGLYRIVLRYYS